MRPYILHNQKEKRNSMYLKTQTCVFDVTENKIKIDVKMAT